MTHLACESTTIPPPPPPQSYICTGHVCGVVVVCGVVCVWCVCGGMCTVCACTCYAYIPIYARILEHPNMHTHTCKYNTLHTTPHTHIHHTHIHTYHTTPHTPHTHTHTHTHINTHIHIHTHRLQLQGLVRRCKEDLQTKESECLHLKGENQTLKVSLHSL